ncbi:FUSC family protein [soil metagenome]
MWIELNSVQLGLATRIVVASLLTFVLCHVFALQQSQWAILTSIIVMQSSVGASLKATFDRFSGSIGGALWGVCVLLAVPHHTPMEMGVALSITLIPLALLAAFKPSFRVAPITAVILLLIPTLQESDPRWVGLDRVFEVGVGSIVALLVSLVIFPTRAHETLIKVVSGTLSLLANLSDQLSLAMAGHGDPKAILDLHHSIRHSIARAENIAEEAARERKSYLVNALDPQPICRTLRRLRNDLTMIGRAMDSPFSAPQLSQLTQTAAQAATEIANYLRNSAQAFTSREEAPPIVKVNEMLAAHAEAMAHARQVGTTRDLPDEMVGRIFSRAFGFKQLSENLQDQEARIDEYAGKKPAPQKSFLP